MHMIDTVVLLLSSDTFTITNPDKFVPNARWITNTSFSAVHGMQSKQNPTKKELATGIYKPRLTLFYSFPHKQVMMKIELSLPKLFYGNNFQELKGKDLAPLLDKLAHTLGQMEVIVDHFKLSKAHVSSVHYSKNIPLTDGSTPYHYIQKIKESNIKMSLDVNQTDYRNEGHSFKWHCNSYEVVFYDKIKDLEKAKQSEKRAIEKDNAIQLHLFHELRKKNKLEILRMEVRLNKRQKMKHLFAKLKIKSDLSLKSLFKPSIAKKVLLHYLDESESKRPALMNFKAGDDKSLLTSLILNNPNLSVKNIFQIYGLSKAFEIFNARELRGMFSKYNQREWHRLMKTAQEIRMPEMQNSFGIIRKYLIRFKSISISLS